MGEKLAKTTPILLEANLAGEASKFGYGAEQLLAELGQINALPRIEIHGLMTMAPWTPEPEKVRPVFRQLRELKERCEQVLGAPLGHLSMGMTNDFEIAIEEGATLVRIGTALFGARVASGPFCALKSPGTFYPCGVDAEMFKEELAAAMKAFGKYIVCLEKTPEECEQSLRSLVEKAIKVFESRGPNLRHGIALDKHVTIILSQTESDRPLCGVYFNLHSPYQKKTGAKTTRTG